MNGWNRTSILPHSILRKFRNFLSAGVVVLVALAAAGFAQTTSGELTGTVYDATGAVVPNATVTATNENTGVVTTSITTSAGQYRINNLLVGKYDLSVTASGFTKAEVKNVDVALNHLATANVTLQIGQSAQTVEVAAEAAAIDTSTAQLQQTYSAQQLRVSR